MEGCRSQTNPKPWVLPPPSGKSVYFFVVWSFLLFGLFGCYFLCCLGAGVFFFAVWAGAQAPPKQQKKNTHPPKQQKKHDTASSDRFFFAVWAGGCVYFFCCLGGGGGGGRVFFCCLGRGRFFFFFFAVWAGDGSSLTYPSAWLVFKRPNNKRNRTAKKTTGSPHPVTVYIRGPIKGYI